MKAHTAQIIQPSYTHQRSSTINQKSTGLEFRAAAPTGKRLGSLLRMPSSLRIPVGSKPLHRPVTAAKPQEKQLSTITSAVKSCLSNQSSISSALVEFGQIVKQLVQRGGSAANDTSKGSSTMAYSARGTSEDSVVNHIEWSLNFVLSRVTFIKQEAESNLEEFAAFLEGGPKPLANINVVQENVQEEHDTRYYLSGRKGSTACIKQMKPLEARKTPPPQASSGTTHQFKFKPESADLEEVTKASCEVTSAEQSKLIHVPSSSDADFITKPTLPTSSQPAAKLAMVKKPKPSFYLPLETMKLSTTAISLTPTYSNIGLNKNSPTSLSRGQLACTSQTYRDTGYHIPSSLSPSKPLEDYYFQGQSPAQDDASKGLFTDIPSERRFTSPEVLKKSGAQLLTAPDHDTKRSYLSIGPKYSAREASVESRLGRSPRKPEIFKFPRQKTPDESLLAEKTGNGDKSNSTITNISMNKSNDYIDTEQTCNIAENKEDSHLCFNRDFTRDTARKEKMIVKGLMKEHYGEELSHHKGNSSSLGSY